MPTLPALSDILEDLGGISAEGIRQYPAPGTATEQDVLNIKVKENRLFELVDGILVEKAAGFWESVIGGAIASAIRSFVIPRKLGVIAGSDGMVRLFPHLNLIRMPDVVFVSNERLPAPGSKRKPVPQLAPDLAVEVLSEGNTAGEMQRKRREYFDAGVRLVWMVDINSRTVDVYTAIDQHTLFHDNQTLDGGAVLPGFALDLASLFAEVAG